MANENFVQQADENKDGDKILKSDLIHIISDSLDFTKKDVKLVVDNLFDTISYLLIDGYTITIQNFGRFYIKEAKPRSFKKVRTNEIISVGYRNLPKIRFSKELINKIKAAKD